MKAFVLNREPVVASKGCATKSRWVGGVIVPCLAVAISLAVAGGAQAQSNWINTTTSAAQAWGTAGNWSPSGVPSGAGVVVNFTAPLTAGQTVTLGSARTIGTLNLGLPGNANRYNFSNTANGLTFRANSGDTLGTATINTDNNSDLNDGHQVQGTVNLQVENLVINNNSVDGRINFQRTFNDGDGDANRSPTVTLNAVAGSNVLQFQIQASDTTSRNQWGKLVVNQNAIFRNSNPNAVSGTVSDQALGRTLSSYLADAITLDGGVLQGSSSSLIYNVSANRGITLGSLGGTLRQSWTIDSVITGIGGLTQATASLTTLNAANTYLGQTVISAGTLRINGDQSGATGLLSVASAATLAGTGTIGGAVTVLGGGTVAPGIGVGTLTAIGSFALGSASTLAFELNAQDTTIGGGVNDLIAGITDLTLAGTLAISGTGNWLTIPDNTSWRLFSYSGTLTDGGLSIGSAPTLASGQTFQIDTSIPGQVNLTIIPEPSALALVAGIATIGFGVCRASRRWSQRLSSACRMTLDESSHRREN